MSLNGKKILLTGASGALGKKVAQFLLADGAIVTGLVRKEGIWPYKSIVGDLSTPVGIENVIEQVGDINWDILINLAGTQHFGPLEAQSPEDLLSIYMVNLLAPVMLTQAVLPGMKQRGAGQIVNVGSVFGSINFAHFVGYSSAKAGMKGFSDAVRREVADFGIDVTYVAPRAVDTPFNSPKVLEFAKITGMAMDDAHAVATKIVYAVERRRKTVYIGFPESFFVRVNALLPGLFDKVLSGNDRKARALF